MVDHSSPVTETDLVCVPRKPTEAMWGGLARAIVMWTRFDRPSEKSLLNHLKSNGETIPDWLALECRDVDHVPPKGSVAVWIYHAMLDAAPPARPAQRQLGLSEGCILCANGNDLPEGEQCAGCQREGHAAGPPPSSLYSYPNDEYDSAVEEVSALRATISLMRGMLHAAPAQSPLERLPVEKLAKHFAVSVEQAQAAQDDIGFMYRELASTVTSTDGCGMDDCPYPDCLVNGKCPSQPSTNSAPTYCTPDGPKFCEERSDGSRCGDCPVTRPDGGGA